MKRSSAFTWASAKAQPIKWTPAKSDKIGVEFLISNGPAGLLLDPGLHKTSISLKAFTILQSEKVVDCMLVIAPLRPAYRVWPKEIEKWTDFNGLKCVVLHGLKKDRALEEKADIYVVNVEGLKWLLRNKTFLRMLYKKKWVLAVDESSKFKSSKSKRFRLLKGKLGAFKRRWILTGSPSPKGLDDLWSQIYLLDHGHSLGMFVTHFRMRYMEKTGYGGYSWTVRDEECEQEIYEKIAPLVLRMSEKDYLKLPRLHTDVDDPILVDLPPNARRVYDQMEALMFAKIGRGEIVAANVGVAMMKCAQIANGGIYKDPVLGRKTPPGDKRPWTLMHDAKTEAVIDLSDEIGGQSALVTYDYAHDLKRLKKAFPRSRHIGKGVSMKEMGIIEDAWNAGELDGPLFVNAQSVAHGLNMQRDGWGIIWHSLTYSWEDYDQLIRRLYRSGRKKPVFVRHIVAVNTVDEVKLAIVRAKEGRQARLFDALKAYGKRRGLYK